jgi:hypothetical protein
MSSYLHRVPAHFYPAIKTFDYKIFLSDEIRSMDFANAKNCSFEKLDQLAP